MRRFGDGLLGSLVRSSLKRHGAVVAVDTETGTVALLDYRAVHDAGVAVNPMVVAGQLAGGVAQGVGSALLERVVYEPGSGQPVAASFADYAMPHAADLPPFDLALRGVPCASNLVGAKPAGEAGTVAAPAAIVNAIVDALADRGVGHLDLPATPLAVWRALADAAARRTSQIGNAAGAEPCRS
ncbi:hypothetical protein CH341_31000 [Rhodoplanes roseus]|uniref:Aldehyde oxidase/xanthine dehydrogenase second molybdopterin binding domain-containing protein n=1 Tax=Rhodoplanes roseus TaxID=29409 RepID=A0A327KBB8_9BRAD|nr:hypothetical protein CH341_31000 [Rhodoplanes roseus]